MDVTFHIGDKQIEVKVKRLPNIKEEVNLSIETENGFDNLICIVKHISSYYEIYNDGSCSENYDIYLSY